VPLPSQSISAILRLNEEAFSKKAKGSLMWTARQEWFTAHFQGGKVDKKKKKGI
jgi:hypothetical protein